MRIDSETGVKAWLIGKFSGSFKGKLFGTAESAEQAKSASYAESASQAVSASFAVTTSYAISASQATTASYMTSEDFGVALNDALDDPNNADVFEKLKRSGKLIVNGGIRVVKGDVEIDTGSLRIKKAIIEYLDDEDALQFKFVNGSDIPPVPSGSVDPEPPCPPPPPHPWPWPWPPFPPVPPPPPPFPPVPPEPPRPKTLNGPSIDYFREGRY